MLLEHIPGGARWRYVWGSCLSFVFAIQLITGICLMTAYSPSASTAWGSVYFIQYQMDFGWFIRGLHHFGSQTMVVLLALHMLQVVIAGAHLPPREINWWLGLGLMGVVLGLSLTGYLLPWDQKGYYATRVATNIASATPFIGEWLQKVVVGGPEYGTPTLTRFFGLHVAVLPALLILLLIPHIILFRRHGITTPKNAKGDGWFWPDQAFKDLIACLVVFGIMVFLVMNGHGHHLDTGHAETEEVGLYEQWAHAGQQGLGANLDAPADPSTEYPARPEWYFLFLFQLLKYFKGDQEIIGTMVIPGAIAFGLFLLPLLGIGKFRPLGHSLAVIFVLALIAAAGTLTCLAIADDTSDPDRFVLLQMTGLYAIPIVASVWLVHLGVMGVLPEGMFRGIFKIFGYVVLTVLFIALGALVYVGVTPDLEIRGQLDELVQQERKKISEDETRKTALEDKLNAAKKFNASLAEASQNAARAINLAVHGIPENGGVYLLRNDPKTQFKTLFLKNCASCHSYGEFPEILSESEFHTLAFKTSEIPEFKDAKYTAADLACFGSKEWILAFLKAPNSKAFYGRARDSEGNKLFSRMNKWVEDQYDDAIVAAEEKVMPLLEKEADPEKKKVIMEKANADGRKTVDADFAKIAAFLALAPEGSKNADGEVWTKTEHAEGYKLFVEKYNCVRCHAFGDVSDRNTGPDLTGYGGADWLRRMVRTAQHISIYGNERYTEPIKEGDAKLKFKQGMMPSFRDIQSPDGKMNLADYIAAIQKDLPDVAPEGVTVIDLDRVKQELIIRYLANDWRIITGGNRITAIGTKE